MAESARIVPRVSVANWRSPNVRKQHYEWKVIQMQAKVMVMNYLAFCLTVNYLKPSYVDWVSPEDKIFFGFLVFLGFGVYVGLDYLMEFLITIIPKFASKNKYIKLMVLNHRGTMRIWAFLLLCVVLVISTIRIGLLLLVFLLRVEALQPFFDSVGSHEAFFKAYGGVSAGLFVLCIIAVGRLGCYILST